MEKKTLLLTWSCALISVIGLSLAAGGQDSDLSFSGLFDVTITTTSAVPVSLESMSINAVLGWGKATAQLDAQLSNSLLDTLAISANAPLGNISLNSSVRFNPSTAAFISWQSGAAFTLLDLAFSNLTSVVDPQTNSYTQWSVSGSADAFDFQSTVKLGICPLEFWEAGACGSWVWFDCSANMSLCAQFDDAVGFRGFTATMTDLVLFEDFWGILGTFSLSINYSLDEKVVSPMIQLRPSWLFCPEFELLSEATISTDPLSVEGLSIYGFRGQCSIGECVTLSFADSLDDAKNSSVTGKADYFEQFGVSGCLPSCCGADGNFEIHAYFERPPAPSGMLFGMGLITVSFDLQLFTNFSFTFDSEFPLAGSGWEMAWTFRVLW